MTNKGIGPTSREDNKLEGTRSKAGNLKEGAVFRKLIGRFLRMAFLNIYLTFIITAFLATFLRVIGITDFGTAFSIAILIVIAFNIYRLRINKNSPNKKTNKPKQALTKSIKEKSTAKKINEAKQDTPKNISGAKPFYNEEAIILDKYAHLKTPSYILKERDALIGNYKRIKQTTQTKFAHDSFKHRHRQGTKTNHIPLSVYYTTFESLNASQKVWYFYWRRQALNGNYLDTDLSYMILFAYELINYTFNPRAAFNVSMLLRLYKACKEKIPKISAYLPDWIYDMLLELGEDELAEDIRHLYFRGNDIDFYRIFIRNKDDISKIPVEDWWPLLSGYSRGKFYKENELRIHTVFRLALKLFQKENEKQGLNLEEAWFETKKHSDSRILFKSALMVRQVRTIQHGYKERQASEYLTEEVTAIFRLADNVTRLLLGEKASTASS